MATRGKGVALTAAVAVCLALAIAAFNWRPIVVQWHVKRLRTERDRVLDLCTAATGSPAEEAVREFVGAKQGKERLLEVYLEAAFAAADDVTSDLDSVRNYRHGAWMLLWLQGDEIHVMRYFDMPNWSFRGSGSGASVVGRLHRGRPLVPLLAALQCLLLAVGYDRVLIPGDADLTFSVVTRRDAEKDILGSPMDWAGWTDGRVALIESVRHQWPRTWRR